MSKCVWVIELAVLTADGMRTASWDIWEAFNTRAEALIRKRAMQKGIDDGALRIKKYIPAPAKGG